MLVWLENEFRQERLAVSGVAQKHCDFLLSTEFTIYPQSQAFLLRTTLPSSLRPDLIFITTYLRSYPFSDPIFQQWHICGLSFLFPPARVPNMRRHIFSPQVHSHSRSRVGLHLRIRLCSVSTPACRRLEIASSVLSSSLSSSAN